MQQKFLQDGHREVIVIQVDLGELGAPAEGKCEDSELKSSILQPCKSRTEEYVPQSLAEVEEHKI